MTFEWDSAKFERMATLIRKTIQPSDAVGQPYVGLEHIGEGTLGLVGWGVATDATSAKSQFRKGDVLFGKLRPYFRKIVRAPFDGICSTDIWVVRPRAGIDHGYLFYLMASDLFLEPVIRASEGTKMPRAKWDYAARLELPLPPLNEQSSIAHILGVLDDKIELNRRMSETLEAIARALFRSWFVDFAPVRAKMEGRWKRGQSLPGLPAHLYDLFPDRLVDSELGEIPGGWEVKTLGDLVEAVKGRSYKSAELVPSDTALVTLKSFARGGGYRLDGLKSFSGKYKPSQVVESGEVVIACTDVTQAAEVIGRPAIVRGTGGYRTLVASLDVLILRPRTPEVTRAFLYFLGGTGAFVEHTYAHTTGTTVLHLSKDAVPTFAFALPVAELVNQFDALASPMLDRIQTLDEESNTLGVLRDTLLPKLISGYLRLSSMENVGVQ